MRDPPVNQTFVEWNCYQKNKWEHTWNNSCLQVIRFKFSFSSIIKTPTILLEHALNQVRLTGMFGGNRDKLASVNLTNLPVGCICFLVYPRALRPYQLQSQAKTDAKLFTLMKGLIGLNQLTQGYHMSIKWHRRDLIRWTADPDALNIGHVAPQNETTKWTWLICVLWHMIGTERSACPKKIH